MHTRSTVVAAILGAVIVAPSGALASSCTSPRYHEFDFFVGRWNVYDGKGRLIGRDVVEKRLKGCVVTERFTDADGSVGMV
jgi:hypothetical protein